MRSKGEDVLFFCLNFNYINFGVGMRSEGEETFYFLFKFICIALILIGWC